MFGLVPREVDATYEAFLASVHPSDRQAVHQANSESISDPDKAYSIEYRVLHPDGAERVVHARGEVLFDQDRRPVRMIGTVSDITERKRAEEALEKAFHEIESWKEQRRPRTSSAGRGGIRARSGHRRASDPIKHVTHRSRPGDADDGLLTGRPGTEKECLRGHSMERAIGGPFACELRCQAAEPGRKRDVRQGEARSPVDGEADRPL
jgi:PAS domain S-box-containing protein